VERLIERCAGLDVHKASVTATVRLPGDQGGGQAETRMFRATTAGLVLLGDWLASFGVTVVGVESTGVYLLEDAFLRSGRLGVRECVERYRELAAELLGAARR
jgi:hypothetical protein